MKWRKKLRRVVSRISASRAIKSHKSVAPSKPETKEQSRDAVTVGPFFHKKCWIITVPQPRGMGLSRRSTRLILHTGFMLRTQSMNL